MCEICDGPSPELIDGGGHRYHLVCWCGFVKDHIRHRERLIAGVKSTTTSRQVRLRHDSERLFKRTIELHRQKSGHPS